MAANEYHFITHWTVRATPREVSEILSDTEALPRWWPAVYLDANELEPGDENGVGKVIDLYTKGWLPYTLRWRFTVTKSNPPKSFTLVADGDFIGRGIWTLAPDGEDTHVIYDWKIRAEKPLLRRFSWLLKPIFAANHRWAMARGEESLNLELERRRAATADERALIPAPPQPTTTSAVPLMAISAAAVALAIVLMRRRSSR
jgi:Polyketide cyclase / dehydrase and lipid transport